VIRNGAEAGSHHIDICDEGFYVATQANHHACFVGLYRPSTINHQPSTNRNPIPLNLIWRPRCHILIRRYPATTVVQPQTGACFLTHPSSRFHTSNSILEGKESHDLVSPLVHFPFPSHTALPASCTHARSTLVFRTSGRQQNCGTVYWDLDKATHYYRSRNGVSGHILN